jgi:protein-S-isoprenylcysteine O-methyltransferase Ste14
MATNLQTETGQGVGELISGIIQDAQTLISQQFTLFKSEVRQDFRNLREAMIILAVALAILLVAGVLLGLMLVHLINYLTSWDLWVCFALVGGGFAALGGGFATLGREKLRTTNVLPEESAKALTENLEWKTKPT